MAIGKRAQRQSLKTKEVSSAKALTAAFDRLMKGEDKSRLPFKILSSFAQMGSALPSAEAKAISKGAEMTLPMWEELYIKGTDQYADIESLEAQFADDPYSRQTIAKLVKLQDEREGDALVDALTQSVETGAEMAASGDLNFMSESLTSPSVQSQGEGTESPSAFDIFMEEPQDADTGKVREGGKIPKYNYGGKVQGRNTTPTIAEYFSMQNKTLGGSSTKRLSELLGGKV